MDDRLNTCLELLRVLFQLLNHSVHRCVESHRDVLDVSSDKRVLFVDTGKRGEGQVVLSMT
jgi:hypothetical protein